METATITPKYVNPAKPGAFSGSVKDASGTYWSVKPEMLHLFQPGNSVTVEYEAVTRNGKTFYNVKQIVGHGAPPPPPPPPTPPPPPPPPQPAYVPPAPPAYPPPQPAPVPFPHTNGHAQPNGHDKDRMMFIMGVTGRAMGSGQYPPTEIKLLALAADEAWDALEAKWGA